MKNKFSVAVVLVIFTSTLFSTSVNASEVQVERDIAATIDSTGVGTSMQSQYVSLSAALATMYASSKGLTLNNFLMTEPTMAASLLGTDPSLVRNKLSSNTAKELNSLLVKNQLTLSKDSYKSMESYANTLIKNSTLNADAAMATKAANWASELGSLRTPELVAPQTPKANTASLATPPAGVLAFGLLFEESLTALVTDFPDVYKQVSNRGLSGDKSIAAWKNSMKNAYKASTQDINSITANDPCAKAAISSIAGVKTNSPCGSCSSIGAYVAAQLQADLANPAAKSSLVNPDDSVIPPSEWNRLQDWQKKAILESNPKLADSLKNSSKNGSKLNCGASSTSVKSVSDLVLPGVFDTLTGKP
jgi:hypothetical protein